MIFDFTHYSNTLEFLKCVSWNTRSLLVQSVWTIGFELWLRIIWANQIRSKVTVFSRKHKSKNRPWYSNVVTRNQRYILLMPYILHFYLCLWCEIMSWIKAKTAAYSKPFPLQLKCVSLSSLHIKINLKCNICRRLELELTSFLTKLR